MRETIRLSNRELDVMNILWETGAPMAAKDIVEVGPSLPMNTVQSVLKGLLKRKYISVAGVVYSNTVLTRSYLPTMGADEYMAEQMLDNRLSKHLSLSGMIGAFLKKKDDGHKREEMIAELEELLRQYRESIGSE